MPVPTAGRNDTMTAAPTLAEILVEPGKADGLPGRVLLGLLAELVGVQSRLTLKMLEVGLEPAAVRDEDRALTIEQAAERVNVAPGTMQRWLRREPFNAAVVVKSRTMVRVSAAMLEQVMQGGAAVRLRRRQIMARAGSGA